MVTRNEYPRPQFRRERWQTLNGEWEFAFDDRNVGLKSGWQKGETRLDQKINVPFSYQYEASGIGDKTQHDIVWYRRAFQVEESGRGKRALLCFNAADYRTDVWINGIHVAAHEGGFAPFSADITDYLTDGKNIIVVRCFDGLDADVPRGKQSITGQPYTCFYTPNSGIWQSVWIEYFDLDCISAYTLLPARETDSFYGDITTLYGKADRAEIIVRFDGKEIKRDCISLSGNYTKYAVKLTKQFNEGYDWSPECPRLVYVDFLLYKNGKLCDAAHTRFAMRKIAVDEHGTLCLNDYPLYQRLILDQGYWVESGLTPPSADALKKDIELAIAMGFNGARKHQKFEDPYFYYYAEELGFLTWCELPSAYLYNAREVATLSRDWQEILAVAKNQTSNICYVPLNESWGTREIYADKEQQSFARALYYLTKAVDPDKLVSTNDGFENVTPTDIVSVHDYEIAKSDRFSEKYGGDIYDKIYPQGWKLFAKGSGYSGQPVLFTEFGGIAMYRDEKDGAWGYSSGAKSKEEFYSRLGELMHGIKRTEFQGYCYTQLTDVQQEVNGLLNADHTPKFDLDELCKLFKI